ncbi:hypothetical protein, partial [Enterobacter cloacae complex sp. GF14B]|uniref:hypothetical protein n=1 Tax=Enterobacter cloacae complex sp. GF14B TaxID=2511982 RepID=UPI001CA4AD4C
KSTQVGMTVAAPLSSIEDMLKRMNDMMNNMQKAPMREPRQPIRPQKWCAIEGKWTIHETRECYFRPKYDGNVQYLPMRPQGQPMYKYHPNMAQAQRPPMGMERPQPVLGQQPPYPGHNAVPVKYMHSKGVIDEQALVPVTPYAEPSPSTVMVEGDWYNSHPPPMEETVTYAPPELAPMYYVANQGVRPPMVRPMMKPRTRNCHNCGADDH